MSVASVVNSQFTWSVYFCVYRYYATPHGSRPPPCICPHLPAHRRICLHYGHICVSSAHDARQNSSISAGFRQCVNCYGISCHDDWREIGAVLQKWYTMQRVDAHNTTPLGWGVRLTKSHLGLSKPRVHTRVSHTNFGSKATCSHAWNGRRRGSHTRLQPQTYIYLLTVLRDINPLNIVKGDISL